MTATVTERLQRIELGRQASLEAAGLMYDAMATGHAVSTYNLLLEEKRRAVVDRGHEFGRRLGLGQIDHHPVHRETVGQGEVGSYAQPGHRAAQRGEVGANTRLRREPCAPAIDVYTGVLYDALDHRTLSPSASSSQAHHHLH